MKTILVCIPCLLVGGTEIQTLRLVQSLTKGPYKVIVVCYFEHDPQMVQAYQRTGCQVIFLSDNAERPKSMFNQYALLHHGLKAVIHQYHPTIAHVQYMAPGALPILVLRLLRVKKIVATLHTDSNIYKNLRLIHFLQRHFVTLFTCVTKTAENHFFGSKKKKHCTIYNCLAPDYRINHPHASHQYRIGIVSRLEYIKGVDIVLPAFASILTQYPQSTLCIVGDGSLRTSMEQQQKALNILDSKIRWRGRIDPDQLIEAYNDFDIVWIPSRSEGFGLSAIEAMANGKVVIANNVGGLSEIINHNTDGILVDNIDSTSLAQTTIELFRHPEIIDSIACQATIKAQFFSFEKYKENILSLYATL